MRFAIPIENGLLCTHFGHCREFAVVEADETTATVRASSSVTPPPHEPGVLPAWLKEQGVDVVIAGGMGGRAKMLFDQAGVEVVTGAPSQAPEELVVAYLGGTLEPGENACDH